MRQRFFDVWRHTKRRHREIMKFQVDFYDAITYGEVSEDLARYKKEFDLAKIPPMQRRRLSSAAKCAFSLLSSFESIDMPVIFSSYEGEINRCFELETALARLSQYRQRRFPSLCITLSRRFLASKLKITMKF